MLLKPRGTALATRAVTPQLSRCPAVMTSMSTRWLRIILVLGASAWALGAISPASASAAGTIAAGPYLPINGPVLGDSGVYWTRAQRRGGGFSLFRARAGERVGRQIFAQRDPGGGRRVQPYLAASDRRIAVQRRTPPPFCAPTGCPSPTDLGLLTAAADGPFVQAGPACEPGQQPNSRDLDVSGQTMAFVACDGQQIRVLDYAESPTPALRKISAGGPPRLAGPYVLGFSRQRLTVFEWRTGRVVYRVSTPAGLVFGDYDVQSDGTMAFSYRVPARDGSTRERLAWASRERPVLNPLATKARNGYDVRLAAGRVVFARDARGRQLLEAGVTDLQSRGRLITRSVVPSEGPTEPLGFDGERVAYAELGCAGPRIRVVSVQTHRAFRPPRCPLRIVGSPRLRGKRLIVRISCRGLDSGCFPGAASLRLARSRSAARRGPLLGKGRGSEGHGRLVIHLSRSGRRLLARRRIGAVLISEVGGDTLVVRRSVRIALRHRR